MDLDNRSRPSRISQPRQTAYYIGTAMMIVGFLTFFSVFVTGAANFGDFSNFTNDARSSAMRAVIGMALLIGGVVVRTIGARGLAGSGAVLDPEQAREDLKPYSRMTGGMVKDVLDAADIDLGRGRSDRPDQAPAVMIRCQACRQLNEEDSKFCQECGKPL